MLSRRAIRSLSARAGTGFFERLASHAVAGRTAIVDPSGASTTYADLLEGASTVSETILRKPSFGRGGRVAFLAPPGIDFVRMLIGTWQAGGVAVPLCTSHPIEELRHSITEADCSVVASSGDEFAASLEPLARAEGRGFFRLEDVEKAPSGVVKKETLPSPDDAALIIFTSGTTGQPKGVLLTHGNLEAHTTSLVEAWEWTSADRILHILPLHHLHGLGNKLLCALWAGASVAFSPPQAKEVWRRLGSAEADGITLFMAVPTNYALLLREADREGEESDLIRLGAAGARSLRLMVSGSMALPTPVLQRWRALTGHTLLERYGMTELGMALSNPLHGDRVVGAVGTPLPGVDCVLVDPTGQPLDDAGCREGGELLVRGPGVFRDYFRRPDATAAAFAPGGWFRTGDHASRDRDGLYRILGRASVDVIKSSGYKISALEIERALLAHTAVEEVAVVGVASESFGQRISAVIVPSPALMKAGGAEAADLLQLLRTDCADQLASYKLPTEVKVVAEIPKNPMGKINKKALLQLFQNE